uniref:Uncharacterized protein n=1 Tax=Arundo donax TaxID=35708 RepID=A0A0A9B406_ARUDO
MVNLLVPLPITNPCLRHKFPRFDLGRILRSVDFNVVAGSSRFGFRSL